MEFISIPSPVAEIAVLLFGLLLGSFLNVCIYRLPKETSIVKPRSQCPHCGTLIAWYDNIPVLSYVLLRAKCRNCGAGISARYPVIEALTAFVSWVVFWKFGLGWMYLVFFFYAASLLTLSVIDLDHRIIPDEISLSGIVIGLLLSALTPLQPFLQSLFGAILGGGFLLVVGFFYEAVRKQEGIGGGDIKLMAMVGAFTGWKGALFTIFGGSLVASFVGIALMIRRRADSQVPIPFGPFLSLASFLYILFGTDLIQAYLRLLTP